MWKLCLPDHVSEELRCTFCKQYLSRLPVYIYPGIQAIGCNRCPILTDRNPIRNISYEAVGKYLSFPCRYKPYGCLKNTLSIHMESHEDTCAYKQYSCPFIPLESCSWRGPSSQLFKHYQEFHAALALHDPTFGIYLMNTYEANFLLNHKGELFIIYTKCEINGKSKIFWCGVFYVGSKKIAEKYLFQLKFKNNGNEMSKLCPKFVQCDEGMNLDKASAVHVNIENIKTSLEDPCSTVFYITVLQNEDLVASEGFPNGSTTVIADGVDENLLNELQCPLCNECMVPPIHQCTAGHSICGACKVHVNECPTCRNKLQEIRNYSLEKMTRLIKYCCKYRNYGCYFVSSSEYIRQHEADCRFGPYDCPFSEYNNCKWKGSLGNIMKHVNIEHENNIFDIECSVLPYDEDLSGSIEDCYILDFQGEIFKVTFKHNNKTFYWSMQYIGPREEATNYMFELDIYDNSESNQRLFIKRNCSSFTPHSEIFNEGNGFVQIPLILIKSFITTGYLIYKCRIVKKNLTA